MSDYCATVLLYLFNPMINSLRMLQETLGLPHVFKALGVPGGFPWEASRSRWPGFLIPSNSSRSSKELAVELVPFSKDPRLAELKHALTLVDSTVLAGLTRLVQAGSDQTRYNTARDGRTLHGWRLHMQLDHADLLSAEDGVGRCAMPARTARTIVLRQSLQAGLCYVGDGGYADRALFDDIVTAASSYVVRMGEDCVFTVVEERLLSREALDANVVRDAVVRLGTPDAEEMNHAVRIIEVQVEPHQRRVRKIRAVGPKHTTTLPIGS